MSYGTPPTADILVADDALLPAAGISWGAVLAGGVIAAAIAAALHILGAGLGAMSVDAVARDTPSVGNFSIFAAAWVIVANTIALAVGGYCAARLSGTSSDTDGVLHGLAVWATAFLVSAVLLGNLVAGVAATAVQAAGAAAGGAASALTTVAGQALPETTPEALIQRAQNTLRGVGGAPAMMTSEQRAAEISAALARRVARGAFAPEDRARLNELVAAEAGITVDEASRRVDAVEAEAQRAVAEAERRAREAADAAARATTLGALTAFGALLLGALAAIIGARSGTRSQMLVTTRGRRQARG